MNSLDRCLGAQQRLADAAASLGLSLVAAADARASAEPALTSSMASNLADALEQQADLLEDMARVLDQVARSLAGWVAEQTTPTRPGGDVPPAGTLTEAT